MSRWARHPVLWLALLAAVTSACAVKVGGTPTAGEQPSTPRFADPDRVHADEALGDLPMWNPCSVVDPEALPKSWTAELDSPVGFEYCLMKVTTDEGTEADVEVGYLYRSTHDLDKYESGKREGGITVVPANIGERDCTRDVVFADGIAMEVRSWPYEDGDTPKMCAISDEVVNQVIAATLGGKAESLNLPQDSIGELDPCDVVTKDMIALVPGITPDVAADPAVTRHSCWWEASPSATLNVQFEVGKLPDGDSSDERQGRTTTVIKYEDDEVSSLCAVDGEHVPYEFESESGLHEHVGIYVYLAPGQVEQACTTASAIADALWPKLPSL